MPGARVRRINRFTVMAMLQAARARRLGLAEESAFSWGLNRAIFYAAAKRGFRGASGVPPAAEAPKGGPGAERTYYLGEDYAYRDPTSSSLRFTIGGETQTPEEFRRQIAARFGDVAGFRMALEEAFALVGGFEETVLRSGGQFYSIGYRPRRDRLVEEWGDRYQGVGPAQR